MNYEGKLPELYPFCSERCRMTDLGRWFREQYVIERDLSMDEISEDDSDLPPDNGRN